ncbi:unnamed protein product [Rhodiola kirilowii]
MDNGAEADKRTAEQKAIDDWLPITSSREANGGTPLSTM